MTAHAHHPKALWILTGSYALFMAGAGCLLASTVLYASTVLKLPTQTAYGVFSAMLALFFIAPLLGGYIASQWGYKLATILGLALAAVGLGCLSVPSLPMFYAGLAFFAVGNSFATPGVMCMIDLCYAKDDFRRESGFTIFYLIFNIGAVLGIFVGGAVAVHEGFFREFQMASSCLVLAFLWLVLRHKDIVAHEGRSLDKQVSWSFQRCLISLICLSILMLPVSLFLFQHLMFNDLLMIVLLISVVVFLICKALRAQNPQRKRLLAFVFLALISTVFWTLYALEPSFLSVFVANNVDTHVWGVTLPAEAFFAFDGVFVILFGVVLSRIWFYLSTRHHNPSLVTKFSAALVIIGIGFTVLALLVYGHGNATPFPAWGVIVAYAIFASGELLVGPLGISMVGSLSPDGMEGFLMGFWQVCMGFGSVIAGWIAMAPNLPNSPLPLAVSNPLYIKVFWMVGAFAILAGLLTFIVSRAVMRVMVEQEPQLPQL